MPLAAESSAARWSGNFRDLNAAMMRMATMAPGGRIDVETDQFQKPTRLGPDPPFVDQPGPQRLATEKDVGADREIPGKIEFLVDQRDAGIQCHPWRVDPGDLKAR